MNDKDYLHKFIDDCWEGWVQRQKYDDPKPTADIEDVEEVEIVPKHAPDTRVARSKATGDKVYLLNDKEMTKRWITSPEVLKGLGFEMSDVGEVADTDLAKYKPVSAAFHA